jgi:hypothetical protein
MPHKCFMLEPVFADGEKALSYECWDQRVLKGFRNPLTGEVKEWPHQHDVGAMWYATWLPKGYVWSNETEAHLIVKTPGGDWDIDNRASNCTLPDDKLHRCWVRHGKAPDVHVDKNGVTCNAGAGSIMIGNYHGFLHNGVLT